MEFSAPTGKEEVLISGRALLCTAWFLAGSLGAFGDFKYTQSSKITVGAMSGALKIAGALSKQARDDYRAVIHVPKLI